MSTPSSPMSGSPWDPNRFGTNPQVPNVPAPPAPQPPGYNYNWPAGYQDFTAEQKAAYNRQPGLAVYINPQWILQLPDGPTKTYFLLLVLQQDGLPHIIP